MTIKLIDEIISKIDQAGIDRNYLQSKYAVSESQINDAEKIIGHQFPASYRYFLSNFGSGDFKGVEFYGLIPDENDVEEMPNTIWFTRKLISRGDLTEGLLVVEDLGDGVLACLDLSNSNNKECPVVMYDPSEPLSSGQFSILADSFGKYFFERLYSVLK